MATSIKNQNAEGEDSVVLPHVSSVMNVDLLVKEQGGVWILHDKPFKDYLRWVEYDQMDNELTIVTQSGKIQGLGLTIPDQMIPPILQEHEIRLIQIRDKKIWDVYCLQLLVREVTLN